jgi:plastocyanin
MLQLTGAAAVAGLAGCTGAGGGGEGSGATATSTPTESDHQETEGENHDEEGSDDGHNHDEGTPQEPSATATVSMRTEGSGQHYGPHVVWIESGGTVTWELESGTHDVTAYHPDNDKLLRIPEAADSWSTELLSDHGTTFERTFETEGVYDYFCTPHEAVGMVGTVIVGEPEAHDQPGLEEPDGSLPEGARSELTDLNKKVNEALGHTH